MSSSEQVLELSIDETNKLRLELGLRPLHIAPAATAARPSHDTTSQESVLELSIHETNELRKSLGLAPLKGMDASKSSRSTLQSAPQPEDHETRERVEKARLERQVMKGMAEFGKNYDDQEADDEDKDVVSWALAMKTNKNSKSSSNKLTSSSTKNQPSRYTEQDLEGMHVAHNVGELEEGATTVLTLADTSLLETTDDSSKKVLGLNNATEALENVDLVDQRKTSQGLKAKRKLELGMGRAGAYAGFDDDEFEELGGAQAPAARLGGSGMVRGGLDTETKKHGGFQIGAILDNQDKESGKDLFGQQMVTSLETRPDTTASDFMTVDEEEAMGPGPASKKKSSKFRKQKNPDKKKKKKSRKSKLLMNLDDDDEDDEGENPPQGLTTEALLPLLDDTAVEQVPLCRKRRRSEDDEDVPATTSFSLPSSRSRFEATMNKANDRAKAAFAAPVQREEHSTADVEEEADDQFLHAALTKACRLNRLKELSGAKTMARGAEAVIANLVMSEDLPPPDVPVSSNNIAFSVDETREFSRALQARAEQTRRQKTKSNVVPSAVMGADTSPSLGHAGALQEVDEDVNMADLADDIKEDDDELEGAGTLTLGRGLGGVIGLLQQTGDLSRPNATREELRGRAKDKRTYEDYESLDLSEVVRIGKNATERDRDLASREIKLEYRDKNGRLLTRKEAFRDLCYQFHGHGSGKRKEEKRNAQIEREQTEARKASNQASAGTFGALKTTQKATGRAFVVHKT